MIKAACHIMDFHTIESVVMPGLSLSNAGNYIKRNLRMTHMSTMHE